MNFRFLALSMFKHLTFVLSTVLVFITAPAIAAQETPWYQETRESKAGEFSVTLDSADSAPSINEFHDWVLSITHKASGEKISQARIAVGGGMPMHGHGLPTQPQVTGYLGDGRYQVEGINFNMLGQWILEFEIVTAVGTDRVIFEVVLDI